MGDLGAYKNLQARAYGAEILNIQGASELNSICKHDLYSMLLRSNHARVEKQLVAVITATSQPEE